MLKISQELMQSFEYFDCDVVFDMMEGLDFLEDARINEKNFFSYLEIKLLEEITKKLNIRLKEVRSYLETFEDICIYS